MRFNIIKEGFKLEDKKTELMKLEATATDPDFWNDQGRARSVMQKIGDIKKEIQIIADLERMVTDAVEVTEIETKLDELELKTYLNSTYDDKNALVSIHAGQGGTEAMDWSNMLFRMYLRFCERRGLSTQVLDINYGEEAGVKSVTFKAQGSYAYGYLKKEAGTHRLVRQSPFNADNLRQTSFALVEVLPELAEVDLPDIQIKDEDLEWQFFHSSSQGGQNVQKVSTAVRLIHKPTGIVVTAQSERFQEQNRKNALNLLRSKLWILGQQEAKDTRRKLKGEYRPASWGTQIRSYVLHPYKMVKDLRTNVESSNPDSILDGELDSFIEAELKLQ
ncbi:peptide chain release factor 2 [Candidatus Woesebacteria bacterium RIFCSPHIGHO2_02_FULL_38_9]|uniref:Peptide chain release factor 2 n=1 Tax=Candidatus Woesebacteria bacterium RIFCSPHIGHO2_01_FULL_39_28 TaxID=1802496 RepID=A0A1F7YIQ6_9BACT|nr:MAG: peptide chain release factor 2 [Candidatus Woesebacteria bacterium RIFCSPHIGHO2_01_FULL_39_28]OGM32033.1 MAG: peptide chain release factor 2 [Candidatus Woesebacteria bacterium RIFCSPHIGHO2_02_FULL_38_9]OGM57141.1 MAG: peptide chain release factor 2 [Candidatus Woesebacteria bacterium RIFCSPLOWO2_01_FULL_38_20]